MSLYTDASLIMYPSGYKEDKIYSLKPTDGSGDLTFTRASTATRVNAEGLIEGVRTNLNTYSQNFTATGGWAALFGATITPTANYGTAPDGTTTSTRIVFSGGSQIYSKTISGLIGNIGVFSLWIKGTAGQTITVTYGGASDKLVTLVSGWNRFYTNANVSSNNTIYINTFLSATARDIEVWGGQVELSPSATEYIPTTTTAVSVGMLANVPRIDYTGGGCGKLLLEPQRTNLFTYSEQLNDSSWVKVASTITENNTTSPDGSVNADKLIPSVASTNHRVVKTITSGLNTTLSIFAKAAGYDKLFIGWNISQLNQGIFFDLTNGTFTNAGSIFTASIENYGNGWYRCSITASSYPTTSANFSILNNLNQLVFAGNGTSGIYLWAAQNETASYVSSYIPTLASSVTRLADAAFKTGISSLIGQTQGTLFFDWIMNHESPNTSEDLYTLTMSDGTGNKLIGVNNYNQTLAVFIKDTTTQFFSNAYTGGADGARIKLALGYANNDVALYINGTQIATDSSATIPTLSQIRLNTFWNGNFPDSSSVNQLLLFKTRLSNTQLAALTTL